MSDQKLKIKQKDDGLEIQPIIGEDTVDNKLQLLKSVSEVQSRLKSDITSDFILAKLGDKEKEGVIEMTSNAYFFKRLLKIVENNARKWEWDTTKKTWTRKRINNSDKLVLDAIGKATFDSYMTRITMTVILNRNVPKNHIMKILGQYDDIEDDETKMMGEGANSAQKAKDEIIAQLTPNNNN